MLAGALLLGTGWLAPTQAQEPKKTTLVERGSMYYSFETHLLDSADGKGLEAFSQISGSAPVRETDASLQQYQSLPPRRPGYTTLARKFRLNFPDMNSCTIEFAFPDSYELACKYLSSKKPRMTNPIKA